MTSATEYFAIAAMLALRSSNQAMPRTRTDFQSLIELRYGHAFSTDYLDKIIRQLSAWNVISVTDDRYAGETLSLYSAKTPEAFDRVASFGHGDIIAKGSSGGADWFSRVFSNSEFWSDLDADELPEVPANAPSQAGNEAVPASDRLVRRNDNRVEIEVLEADIRSIVDELEASNEIGAELGDEKEVISGELKAAETLIAQPAFRLSKLSNLVIPVLQYLAEKFASGAIGELAKRLIAAILGLS